MIEEIIECLGFHRCARSFRLWKISWQFEREHKQEVNLLIEYDAKERLSVAVLQRIRRFERDRQEYMATESPPATPLPHRAVQYGCSDVSKYGEFLEKELEMAYRICYVNRSELMKLTSKQPKSGQCTRLREWRKIREIEEYEGKSMHWMDSRENCAMSDGCCGQTCGCCEEPLVKYLKPTKDSYELQPTQGFYGHCTSECRCCILRKGTYVPDAGIERMRRDLLLSDKKSAEFESHSNVDSSSEETVVEKKIAFLYVDIHT